MTTFQKVIKYLAFAFAIFLAVSIISGAVSALGLLSGFFDSDNVLNATKTYTVSNNITEINIKINAADFSIKQADEFSVESNLKHLTVKEKDGVLTIEETKKFGLTYNDAVLVFCVPKETQFKKADITTGAGKVTIDQLFAESLTLELGAGEVKINSLNANKNADINGGAGKITILGGSLSNLDLNMGVGQLNLTSAIVKNGDFDLGIGETNINLIGSKKDYNINVEKGIGSITLNGQSISGLNLGGGNNKIEINGGIGAIKLAFTQ